LKRFEAEVIDRLFTLNAERAAEEERLGIGQKPGKKAKKAEIVKETAKRPSIKPPASVYPPRKPDSKSKSSDHKHLKKAS
jgi:hypothetical protein